MTSEEAAQRGAKGGQATVDKYGLWHMRTIGASGFAVYRDRYWGGSTGAALHALQQSKPLTFRKQR